MSQEITSVPEAWYYADGQKQNGPHDRKKISEMLSARQISPEILVWTKGMPQWLPARSTPLAGAIDPDSPPPVPTSSAAATTPPAAATPIEKVYPLQPLRSKAWIWWGLISPGFPQIVFGQPEKALSFMAASACIIGATYGYGALVVIPLGLIDAAKVREAVLQRGWVGKWEWFPGTYIPPATS